MIIFLGPPGSGKGTQAQLLKKRDSINCFSVGDLLRQEVSNKTEIGKLIENKLKEGKLVETIIIVDLLKRNFTDGNFVLDGFPRNLEQAYELDLLLKSIKNYIIFNFVLTSKLVESRLATRKLCKDCNSPNSNSSKECIFCGSVDYYMRLDDNSIIIKNRIKIYETEHKKILEYYKNNSNFISINANEDMETVYQSIRTCLINKSLL